MKGINMKTKLVLLGSALFIIAMCGFVLADPDAEGGKDYPGLTRLPNYFIESPSDENDFNFFEFPVAEDKQERVEGKYFHVQYHLSEGQKAASNLQIIRNYSTAITAKGGKIMYNNDSDLMTFQILKDQKETWIQVYAHDSGRWYDITVVERQAMKQEVSFNSFLDELNATGHVALYINFDTGKAEIKPDSKDTIDKVVSMLKGTPDLKVSIEGHTDNVGDAQKNKVLSEDRAKAVKEALVKAGIETERLTTAGFGQEKPIADNATDEGKAKNRRVELVKKNNN
jgi:OmpA-OmpF porin, OOP family